LQKFPFSLCISPCLSKRWFNRPFACPIVSSLFKLQSEFLSPASNDSPPYHHMDVIGDDVVQETLIMRDQQYPKIRAAQRIHSMRHGLERVDVQPAIGFIQNGVFWFEHGQLQNFSALFFAA